MSRTIAIVACLGLGLTSGLVAVLADEPGEGPALGTERVTQEEIQKLSLREMRTAGLRMFTTPFNRHDGYGDGPHDPAGGVALGGRPTLQGNGTFLRVNGLDAQTCLECHTIVSNATIPATLGIGGAGGSNANAMIMTSHMDPADFEDGDGIASFNGRFANPPAVFGSGGVELVALEMTADLQALEAYARAQPLEEVPLITKGVSFGTLTALPDGSLDTSELEGIDSDLVVRPFGRKGEFFSIRDFDIGAMQFHFGMQPVEVVGAHTDADGDGVANEILEGELSVLGAFVATLDRPFQTQLDANGRRGEVLFSEMGCADCHRPHLDTQSPRLPQRFPEVARAPYANVYRHIDLSSAPTRFRKAPGGGIRVPMFSDLKRHDMGPGLAESFALVDAKTNREFVTARLWGVADTAPYLHDGRATTLTDAILLHGGEAQGARDAFAGLDAEGRIAVLAYLRSLRTPRKPAGDL